MTRPTEDINSICFMNSNMAWGGGEKWHFKTACHLRDLGFRVMVITNKQSELYKKLLDEKDIILKSVGISNLSFLNPFKVLYIRSLLKKQAISSVFLGLSIDVKLGGFAAKLAGVRNIIYRRGAAVPVKNSVLNRIIFRSVLTAIVTNSEDIRKKLFQNNPKISAENKVHTIYNGVDLHAWPKPKTIEEKFRDKKMLILGNAGRLVEQKGQTYLIQIAEELKKRRINFKLLIAGDGKLEKALKLETARNKLEKEIVFLGFVENMQDFLSGLDIYLSTSLHEGSSHVVIEAMAAGKPVLAFNISSMPELVENEKTGYLIPFADTQLFAEKLVYLANNRALISTFGANARKLVESNFDFQRNMEQVIELIKQKS